MDRTELLRQSDKKNIWHPFTQMKVWNANDNIIIDKGEGFYLIDTQGNRYIDGVSSLWCNVHGHRVKKIDDAIKQQLEKIAHSTLLGLGQTKSIELGEKLIQIAPKGLTKVFYSDAGATAVEIALKMAYQYYYNTGQPHRKKFIALSDSYHGDTIGSVSVGGISTFHKIFAPLLFETFFVPCPNQYRANCSSLELIQKTISQIENFLKQNSGQIAAVIIEPLVQGAAGIIVHPKGFLKALRDLTYKYDVLLIVDEVATGFGRTGKMFACEHENVSPDLMTMAKGITAGYLPLAATLATEKIYESFLGEISQLKTFFHGHTYTGNALACAAAIANLELFEENKIIEKMPPKIDLLDKYLNNIATMDLVGNTRQCGLMAGIEIVKDKATKQSFDYHFTIGAKLCEKMRAKGLMLRPLGDVLVIMPPVGIDIDILDKMLDTIQHTIKNDLAGIINEAEKA